MEQQLERDPQCLVASLVGGAVDRCGREACVEESGFHCRIQRYLEDITALEMPTGVQTCFEM